MLTPMEGWIAERTNLQKRTMDALRNYQFQEVMKTIEYARKNSAFYKRQFKHVKMDDLDGFEAFSKLPFTYPKHIKECGSKFLCVPVNDVKRIVTINTSGTTGQEKRIYFTEEDLEMTIDFFQHGMKCLTDSSDRVLVLLPGKAYGTIGDLLKKALARSSVEAVVHGVLKDLDIVEKIVSENEITCIVGIPMQILYLSRKCPHLFERHVRKVLLSTDYVPDALVEELKSRYDCEVFNHYGMTEMGYGGGVECQRRMGYHMREGELYFEIVDPKTGRNVPDGTYGEVVFTTFRRQAMPLIRYRTGDIARFVDKTCECGTFLRAMEKVKGRIVNGIQLGNNQILHLNTIDESILKFHEIFDYRAAIAKADNREKLLLNMIHSRNLNYRKIEPAVRTCLEYDLNMDIDIVFEWTSEACMPKVTNSMIKRTLLDLRRENDSNV